MSMPVCNFSCLNSSVCSYNISTCNFACLNSTQCQYVYAVNKFNECIKKYNICEHAVLEQQKLSAPMPLIGYYVAAVCLVCTLAMVADILQGYRRNEPWLPFKFFGLNATTITLLAVAMKLPLDLSNSMPGDVDQMAKLTSTLFLCIVIGNFLSSLVTMDDKALLTNLMALAIMVIVVLVNVGIQIGTGAIKPSFVPAHTLVMISMFLLLGMCLVTGVAVPTLKTILELRYKEMHTIFSNGRAEENARLTVSELQENVTKYWVMAKTTCPQFVISHIATCYVAGELCLVVILVLYLRFPLGLAFDSRSDYKGSTSLVYAILFFGANAGYVAAYYRLALTSPKGRVHRNSIKVETYWIQSIVMIKESSLFLDIRSHRCRKFVHATISKILNFLIRAQKVAVIATKVLQIVSTPFLLLLHYFFALLGYGCRSRRTDELDLTHLRRYVFRLEGMDSNTWLEIILKHFYQELTHSIETAKKEKPLSLMGLMNRSTGFMGLTQFDSDQVRSEHCKELPNCWSLVVATLASIAVSLPNLRSDITDGLVCSVTEGLRYIRLVEGRLDTRGSMVDTGKAADVVWTEVELYRKWLDKDLRETALKAKTSKESLDCLSCIAFKTIREFTANINLVKCPVRVISANSMYRTSQTLLLYCGGRNGLDDDQKLFDEISVMIADIITACLSNLPRAILWTCYSSAIEKRVESVNRAARVFGETAEILENLQGRELPNLNADQLAYIDEWRAMMQQNLPASDASSGNDTISSASGELQLPV